MTIYYSTIFSSCIYCGSTESHNYTSDFITVLHGYYKGNCKTCLNPKSHKIIYQLYTLDKIKRSRSKLIMEYY